MVVYVNMWISTLFSMFSFQTKKGILFRLKWFDGSYRKFKIKNKLSFLRKKKMFILKRRGLKHVAIGEVSSLCTTLFTNVQKRIAI